jgi:hypothetical protein
MTFGIMIISLKMTVSTMTLRIMALSIETFSITDLIMMQHNDNQLKMTVSTMTLSIMALSIETLSITNLIMTQHNDNQLKMTVSTMTLSIVALSITDLIMTLSINYTQHNDIQQKQHYASNVTLPSIIHCAAFLLLY